MYIPPKMSNLELERELLEGEDCTVCTEGTYDTGKACAFLQHDGLHARISPEFADIVDLYRWMKANGFQRVGSGSGYLRKYRKVYA